MPPPAGNLPDHDSREQGGFRDRLEALVADGSVHESARRLPGVSEDLADDAVQDVVARLLGKRDEEMTHVDDPRAFVFRAVMMRINEIRRHGRLRRTQGSAPLAALTDSIFTVDMVEKSEETEQLFQAIARLPDLYRNAVMLRFFEGLGFPEIASATGAPLSTAKERVYRATQLLREALGANEGTSRKKKVIGRRPIPTTAHLSGS